MAEELSEDVEMELEAMEAIYMEQYTLLDGAEARFSIAVSPHPTGEGENHVSADIVFCLPADYPDTVASYELSATVGLNSKGVAALQGVITAAGDAGVGAPMVWDMVEAAKEWLLENNRPPTDGSMHSEMMARLEAERAEEAAVAREEADTRARETEAAARKKRIGTPMTAELFLAWRDAFEAEMGMVDGKEADEDAERPTGLQLFLYDMVGGGTADEEDLPSDFELEDDDEELGEEEEWEWEEEEEGEEVYEDGEGGGGSGGGGEDEWEEVEEEEEEEEAGEEADVEEDEDDAAVLDDEAAGDAPVAPAPTEEEEGSAAGGSRADARRRRRRERAKRKKAEKAAAGAS